MLTVVPQWGQLQVNGGSAQALQVTAPNGVLLDVGMSSVTNIDVGLPATINLDIGVQGPPGSGGAGTGNSYFPSGW